MHVLPPEPGLPDMVYAANGAFIGRRHRLRRPVPLPAARRRGGRAPGVLRSGHGWRSSTPTQINEGEGDFAYLPAAYGGLILAGYGFRTEPAAHAEAQEVLGRPVVSLRLVDPRFYHLDTALAALDDGNVAYYPDAFSPASQRVLRQLFPDAVLADEADAVRVRAQPGQRRPARRAQRRGDRHGAQGSPRPATCRCWSSCPS